MLERLQDSAQKKTFLASFNAQKLQKEEQDLVRRMNRTDSDDMSREDGLEGQALLNMHLKRMKENEECEATTFNRQNSAYSQAVYEDRNIISQMVNREPMEDPYILHGEEYSSKTNIHAGPRTMMADEHYGVDRSGYNIQAFNNPHQSEADLDHKLRYEGKKIHIPLVPLNVRKLDS